MNAPGPRRFDGVALADGGGTAVLVDPPLRFVGRFGAQSPGFRESFRLEIGLVLNRFWGWSDCCPLSLGSGIRCEGRGLSVERCVDRLLDDTASPLGYTEVQRLAPAKVAGA